MSDRAYDTPPRSLSSLEQRLRNIVGADHVQLRARRQLGYMAVLAALGANARDDEDLPLFAVRGGVAIELLLGLRARATKDLDASVRTIAGEIEPRLRDALAHGWDDFTFRLVSWEPIHNTGAHRGDIKLAYKGRPFATVLFEAAPSEGQAGQAVHFAGSTLVDPGDLGLTPVDEVPLVTLGYLIAQKLHACTDHSIPEWDNDRARDLIDVLLVSRLVKNAELADVREACLEIFRLRGKHAWPPTITVLQAWPRLYQTEIAKTPGFVPSDVEQAAADVNVLIAQIDAATD